MTIVRRGRARKPEHELLAEFTGSTEAHGETVPDWLCLRYIVIAEIGAQCPSMPRHPYLSSRGR